MFPLISHLEHVDFLIRPSEQDLIEKILVRSCALTCAVEEIDVPLQRTEGEEDKGVFEPDTQLYCRVKAMQIYRCGKTMQSPE